jgi:hypothetical protein
MGLAIWGAAALLAFALARMLRSRRRGRWFVELGLALVTAAILGLTATALDFGGWEEPDWRAALFVFAGAFAAIGMFRFAIVYRSQT